MELILRDDDLSYFAEPSHLESLFNGIWEHEPIHFATIPYVYTRQVETPLHIHHEKEHYWIGDNEKLVEFLKEKIEEGKIKIWQHGFTHKDTNSLHELESRDKKKLYMNIKKGKEHLEKTFNITIDTMVAPHDRFSKEAIEVLEELGFKHICRGYSPLPRELNFDRKSINSFYTLFKFYIKYRTHYRYPQMLTFNNHKEFFTYRVQHIMKYRTKFQLQNLLKFHKDGYLGVVTHYRNMSRSQKEFIQLLLKIKNDSQTKK